MHFVFRAKRVLLGPLIDARGAQLSDAWPFLSLQLWFARMFMSCLIANFEGEKK